MASDKTWLPLESNPDVMNKFLANLGVPQEWAMVDILGLEDEHLENVPKPVLAILLLFPGGEKHEEFCEQQKEQIDADGQTVSDRVYFMQQTIKNACGTVALIHAVANNTDKISLDGDSALNTFLERTKDMAAEERGQELEMDETICAAHEESAQEGQTQAPDADEDVNLHFAAFVNVDEQLYELDGRKSYPINHGSTTEETFLQDASAICKLFIERDPENVNFTVVALAAATAPAEDE